MKSLKNTCHTRALLRWRFTTKRRYIKCMHLYLTALWENAESRLKAPFISILARYNVRDSQPSLAASPGVHIIPGRRAGLASSSRYSVPRYPDRLHASPTFLVDGSTNRLMVPSVRHSTVGSRAFPAAASSIWNTLPENVVSASTLQSFEHHLKTFCSDAHSWTLFCSGPSSNDD